MTQKKHPPNTLAHFATFRPAWHPCHWNQATEGMGWTWRPGFQVWHPATTHLRVWQGDLQNYNPTKTKMARWNIHHEDVYVLFPWRIHSCLAYLPTWRHIKTNRIRKYMLILGQPVFRKEASSILGVFIFNCFLDGALGCLHFCWVKLVCVGCPSFPGSFQNDTVV